MILPKLNNINSHKLYHNSIVADHWIRLGNGKVRCKLDPRGCVIKPGKLGYCGVRGNVNGELHTFNYGKCLTPSLEYIETEAVNHFSPGAKILSMGNIGCMMKCVFCQNWETSQVEHLPEPSIETCTPSEIIDICLKNGIEILSWTYNDPVVWHEFVVETSKIAHQHGIKTLYKSAFFIEEKPVEELIDVIDIFSISLKSMEENFYLHYTGARLKPVLDRIKQVYSSGKHLEISQLLVSRLNDNRYNYEKTIDWVLGNLDEYVPLHFVRFHPAYKYLDVERTDRKTLLDAREAALKAGIKFCYIGNLYENGLADLSCQKCKTLLVKRYGLTTTIMNLSEDGMCTNCGAYSYVKYPFGTKKQIIRNDKNTFCRKKVFEWTDEVNALHVALPQGCDKEICLKVSSPGIEKSNYYFLDQSIKRIIISKSMEEEDRIVIEWDKPDNIVFFGLLDRAHFPTQINPEEN